MRLNGRLRTRILPKFQWLITFILIRDLWCIHWSEFCIETITMTGLTKCQLSRLGSNAIPRRRYKLSVGEENIAHYFIVSSCWANSRRKHFIMNNVKHYNELHLVVIRPFYNLRNRLNSIRIWWFSYSFLFLTFLPNDRQYREHGILFAANFILY